MKNKKIIVGNWKMNPATAQEAEALFSHFQTAAAKAKNVVSVICPPFIYIDRLAKIAGKKKPFLGAQNLFSEPKGSFTGEVSADQLKQFKLSHIILGHSERRKLGETDELINKKLLLALKSDFTPILCIGESTRDEEGQYLAHIKTQIQEGLKGITKAQLEDVIIAYEPVWAIGATEAMQARDVHEMMIYIKKTLVDLFKVKQIPTPILYGGAVDATNAGTILKDGEADGLLIGRQSLVEESFAEILTIAHKI